MPQANVSVIWLDRNEARIFHVSEERMERKTLKGAGKASGAFFNDIGVQLAASAGNVVILGSGGEGAALREHLERNAPDVAERIVGCETLESPADHEIAAYALRALKVR